MAQSWPQSPKSQANNRKISQHIVSVLETRTRTHLRVSVRIKSWSRIVIIVSDRIRIGGLIVVISNRIATNRIYPGSISCHQILTDRHPVVSYRNRSYQNATTRNRTYQNVKFWQNVPISCDLSIVAFVTDRALV